MAGHINVTLRSVEQSKDIRIPTKIEVKRLIRELDNIFSYPYQRTKYQLHIVNKGLILDEGDILAQHPVTTGDILEIREILE